VDDGGERLPGRGVVGEEDERLPRRRRAEGARALRGEGRGRENEGREDRAPRPAPPEAEDQADGDFPSMLDMGSFSGRGPRGATRRQERPDQPRIATKWQTLPARTKRCHTAWA
jgi:hypothetical protein